MFEADYSHLSTEELNQLIHDLSRESARSYHAGFLDELARASEALGLYDTLDHWQKGFDSDLPEGTFEGRKHGHQVYVHQINEKPPRSL